MKIHSVVLRGGKQFEGGNAIEQKLHGSSQFGMLQNFFFGVRKYCQNRLENGHWMIVVLTCWQNTSLKCIWHGCKCCVMHTVVIYKAPGFVSIIRKTLFIALLGYTMV